MHPGEVAVFTQLFPLFSCFAPAVTSTGFCLRVADGKRSTAAVVGPPFPPSSVRAFSGGSTAHPVPDSATALSVLAIEHDVPSFARRSRFKLAFGFTGARASHAFFLLLSALRIPRPTC